MWAEGWERGERGKSQRVGQLLPDRGPEWMGIHHHEQEIGPPSKLGFLIIFATGSIITACTRLIMSLISLNHSRGSETVPKEPNTFFFFGGGGLKVCGLAFFQIHNCWDWTSLRVLSGPGNSAVQSCPNIRS